MTLLTVSDVARMCKLSSSTIYDLKEEIGWYKLGGSVRFREDDVVRWLDGKKVGGRRNPPPMPRLKHLKLPVVAKGSIRG